MLSVASGCVSPYEHLHAIQWNSRDQILQSDASQVRVRAAQSRAFDTRDRMRMLEAVVQSLQDAGFQIDVLDEEIGVVSGRKFVPSGGPAPDAAYHLYQSDSLMLFSSSYRTWGQRPGSTDGDPRWAVGSTVRWRTLEQSLFLDAHAPE